LRDEGHEVHGYFFNPNIHPFSEYNRRRDALKAYADTEAWPVIYAREYPVEEYFRRVAYRETERCSFCHLLRLERAAGVAKRGGYDAFTTTLLVSPFQKHDTIREVGEILAGKYGISFMYRDFRTGFKEGVKRSKELGMYRQQYCGCVYSEKERYARKKN
jgi:hypothetical protein